MATLEAAETIELSPSVRRMLARLRGRVRAYVVLEGAATALCFAGAAFWFSLAVDWFFEPPPLVRGLLLALTAIVFLGIILRMAIGRLIVPLSDASMANLLERRFPALGDSLLTAVLLADAQHPAEQCSPLLLAETCRRAQQRIGGLRLGEIFNPRPLERSIAATALLALSIGVFAFVAPQTLRVWTARNIFLSPELWPRSTHLEVLGMNDGVVKVARGADFALQVRADTRWPRVPQVVEVRYRTESGARGRVNMSREGRVDPTKDPYQQYTYTFQGVLAPIVFEVRGGDVRLTGLRIVVVESPALTEMQLVCRFPAYMQRGDRVLPVSGVTMEVPLGAEVALRAKSNKPLTRVEIESSRGAERVGQKIVAADAMRDGATAFELPLGAVDGDTTLALTLFDGDGIRSRDPTRLVLAARADEAPQVALRLDGIGTAVTPQAHAPLRGEVRDDYGLARVWAEAVVDEGQPKTQPLLDLPRGPSVADLTGASVDLSALSLAAGQKLTLSIHAADRCDLDPAKGPNVGVGERWALEVVTPDQLRAMLESRELVLRQRFEVIVSEVVETRDLLLKAQIVGPAQPSAAATGEAAEAASSASPGTPDGAGAEPGDVPHEDESKLPADKRLALQLLRVERAWQNTRKNAQETLGVAESFDDIHKELVNNRIDTEELKRRIEEGIAQPLHRVAEELFPVLTAQCESLQKSLDDPLRGPEDLARARRQADAILAEMRQALDRMLEMEDFNEAVELLRQIIEMQNKLDQATKQRHRESIRELME